MKIMINVCARPMNIFVMFHRNYNLKILANFQMLKWILKWYLLFCCYKMK